MILLISTSFGFLGVRCRTFTYSQSSHHHSQFSHHFSTTLLNFSQASHNGRQHSQQRDRLRRISHPHRGLDLQYRRSTNPPPTTRSLPKDRARRRFPSSPRDRRASLILHDNHRHGKRCDRHGLLAAMVRTSRETHLQHHSRKPPTRLALSSPPPPTNQTPAISLPTLY